MSDFFKLDANIQADTIMDKIAKQKKSRKILFLKEKGVEQDNSIVDLTWKIKEVNENSNPIPVPENTRLRLLKRIIGKLIRTYTYKQVQFNMSTSKFLELIMIHIKSIYSNQQETNKKINDLEEKVREDLFIRSQQISLDEIMSYIKQIEAQQRVTNEKIDENDKSQNKSYLEMVSAVDELKNKTDLFENNNLWLKSLNESFTNLNNWVSLLHEKIESVESFQDRARKEMFAEIKLLSNNQNEKNTGKIQVESKILNFSKYNRMINENGLKINLGSGTLIEQDYLNVDMRELDGIDIVGDARDLPIPESSVIELYLSHIIEHFSEVEMENKILPYWYSLLKRGGKIRIICPNWEAMLQGYSNGEISYNQLKEVTFGSQEYEGNFHYNMFTPDTMRELLDKIGFKDIRVISEKRKNGLCYEMEVEGERN